jgi:hypothetical protein
MIFDALTIGGLLVSSLLAGSVALICRINSGCSRLAR